MKVYIIKMPWNETSCLLAKNAYQSCEKMGYETEYLNALVSEDVEKYFDEKKMKEIFNDQVPYYNVHKQYIQLKGMRGSVCSHIMLWEKCIELNEPIIIFEHDALMTSEWKPVQWQDILHLDWEGSIKRRHLRSTADIYRNSVLEDVFHMGFSPFDMPDIITMNCVYAYAIRPHAASKVIEDIYKNGFFAADRMLREPLVKIETINPKIAEEQTEAINISTTSE